MCAQYCQDPRTEADCISNIREFLRGCSSLKVEVSVSSSFKCRQTCNVLTWADLFSIIISLLNPLLSPLQFTEGTYIALHSCLCCDLLTLLAYVFFTRPCGVSHINRHAVSHSHRADRNKTVVLCYKSLCCHAYFFHCLLPRKFPIILMLQ